MKWFLESNDTTARLLRTIAEAIIGVLVANIDVLFSGFQIPAEAKTLIVGLTVAIMSPILAQIRSKQ